LATSGRYPERVVQLLPCGVTQPLFCVAIPLRSTSRRKIMSLSSHLQELKKKHQTLSDHVEVLQRSPGVDDLELAKLKKKKLQIKEEITRLAAH
jgi:hypothetical protein